MFVVVFSHNHLDDVRGLNIQAFQFWFNDHELHVEEIESVN